MNETQIRQIIKEEIGSLFRSDRFLFEKILQILDGRNIQLGSGTGTKIGTATTEKIGFYNTTPVIQRSAISAPSGGSPIDVEARTAINSIRQVLIDLGFTA